MSKDPSELQIEFIRGGHQSPIPEKAMEKLFQQLFSNIKISSGIMKIIIGQQTRGNQKTDIIKLGDINLDTKIVPIKVQVNGKKSKRFECTFTVPREYHHDLITFKSALEEMAEIINNPPTIDNNPQKDAPQTKTSSTNQSPGNNPDPQPPTEELEFEHLFADEDSLCFFALEIKNIFSDRKEISREELIEKLPSGYGDNNKLIDRLVAEKILEQDLSSLESSVIKIGEKGRDILADKEEKITEIDEGEALSISLCETIKRLEEQWEKHLALKKEIFQHEKAIAELKARITPEMIKESRKFEILRKVLT